MELLDQNTVHLGPGEGVKALWVLGELVTYKVTSEQTGGAYLLLEVAVWPGSGAPPHVQHREDECLYVVEGEFEILDNSASIEASAGSLIYVPKGNLHAYRNVGEGIGRMLVSQTPGSLQEQFFEELGEEATEKAAPLEMQGPPDVGRIAAIAARYGIEIPPPPT